MRNPRTPRRRSKAPRRTRSTHGRSARAILIETAHAPGFSFEWLRAVRAKLRIGKRHAHGR